MLLGSSNVDNATELAAYEGRYGPLRIRRSYNQPAADLPATWAGTAAAMDVGIRASVWSFKPNVASFATGAYDTRARAFLDSIPVDGYRKIPILHHEPEDQIKKGLFTPAQFKAASARWDALVKATGRLDLLAMVCFAGTQCFDGQTLRSHGWDANDLTPEDMAVCFDAYNAWPEAGRQWREASERLGLQAAWASASGRRWGISETGCYEHPDGPAIKVQWTRDMVSWADSEGAEFVTYWDNHFESDPDPNKRRLHSSPEHIEAWRELTAEGSDMILWLADVLRAAGLTVVEHAGWTTRTVRDSNGDPLVWAPRFGVVHATAAPASQADSVQVAVVRDGRTGLPGPIANACVDRQGHWHVVAAGRCNTTLTGTAGPFEGLGNRYALGVEACNDNVSEPWPAIQYESYHRGWAAICRRLGWTASNLVGHKEHTPGHKSDPTFNMGEFRANVTQSMEGEPEMELSSTLTDNSGQFHGVSVNQTLVWLLKWTNSVANGLGLAARLDAILAAAEDDGDTTVILDDTALVTVREVRDAVAALAVDVDALPGAVAAEHAGRLAS
ncbi:MAG TPA: N-acetylmuramoyl-L-alanine amidase [Jiangellaceae bacterium]|nr:N-acetylmuramoyl-L-alanine amidase [Jiangellaceae bacterium]